MDTGTEHRPTMKINLMCKPLSFVTENTKLSTLTLLIYAYIFVYNLHIIKILLFSLTYTEFKKIV